MVFPDYTNLLRPSENPMLAWVRSQCGQTWARLSPENNSSSRSRIYSSVAARQSKSHIHFIRGDLYLRCGFIASSYFFKRPIQGVVQMFKNVFNMQANTFERVWESKWRCYRRVGINRLHTVWKYMLCTIIQCHVLSENIYFKTICIQCMDRTIIMIPTATLTLTQIYL